jgi:hypothetical protein
MQRVYTGCKCKMVYAFMRVQYLCLITNLHKKRVIAICDKICKNTQKLITVPHPLPLTRTVTACIFTHDS